MKIYRLVVGDGDVDILNGCDIESSIVHPMMYLHDMATGLPIVCKGYILHLNVEREDQESFLRLRFGDRISFL
jgi:hypothetical protein